MFNMVNAGSGWVVLGGFFVYIEWKSFRRNNFKRDDPLPDRPSSGVALHFTCHISVGTCVE